MKDPPVHVREATALDWDFMRKTWRETFRTGSPAVRGADPAFFADEMMRLFAAIMPGAEARIACDPLDEESPLGFVCYHGSLLYYVYVDQAVRREGIAAKLLDGLPIKRYSFTTEQGIRRLKPATRGWLFCPRFTFSP